MSNNEPLRKLTEQEFAIIVRDLSGPLVLYARQLCRDAEDIVQEALLSLQAERVAPAQVRAWLFRVVRHRALNNLRGEGRRRKHETNFGQQQAAWFDSPESLTVEASEAVAALQSLPDEERETIVARLWGGLTLNEVASLTNTSLATAQRRYIRGLERLREVFQVEPITGLNLQKRKL